MNSFRVFCVLCGLAGWCFALDREAFTFTSYNLDIRIEPEQQRLGVRGRITLRNDSGVAQKNLSLQISSTLDWTSVQLNGKPVQFVSQPYTSDIDHTGALSEAIVSLAREVPPKGTVDLDIGYEGVIPLDTTRLARIGVPEGAAKHTDWDRISKGFTAVRGIGYVAWYPVATEAASLSEGNSVEETVDRWKARHADTKMGLLFESTVDTPIFFSGTANLAEVHTDAEVAKIAAFSMVRPGINAPTFVAGNYQKLASKDLLSVQYLPGEEEGAKAYAEAAEQIDTIVPVGGGSGTLQILGLPDKDAAPFVSEGMLLCPFKSLVTNEAMLSIVYAKARQSVLSPRAWIQDGLAHYAQLLYIERQGGREAALHYLEAHRQLLVKSETAPSDSSAKTSEAAKSLVNAPYDLDLQTKAMYVWWMLRDMAGELALKKALAAYRPDQDREPSYMQRLVEAQAASHDLEWFFDDWVYRDHGLPDFRVESVYPRPLVNGGFMVTITAENLGNAAAEVPVTLRIEGGEVTKRLKVPAKSKAAIRIEAVSTPTEVLVNDGSVPESDMSNNTFKIDLPTK